MAQRSTPCGISLGVCRLRVTKIDPTTGCVISEADNSFVLEDIISVAVTPNIESGTDTTLIGGCGCKIATYKAQDILKRLRPDADDADQVGRPGVAADRRRRALRQLDDAGPGRLLVPDRRRLRRVRRPVAIEFWTKNWVDDAQDSDPALDPLGVPVLALGTGSADGQQRLRSARLRRLHALERLLGRRPLRRRPRRHLRRVLVLARDRRLVLHADRSARGDLRLPHGGPGFVMQPHTARRR